MDDTRGHITAPIATPYWGAQNGSAFTVRAISIVKAQPQPILDALLDVSKWPDWNRFVPRATLSGDSKHETQLQPDILFTEHVDMAGRGRSTIVRMRLLMTTLDELDETKRRGFKVVWLGKGYPSWALRSERVHKIYQTEGNEQSIYDVYETFSGPLAWAVKFFVGKSLLKRFGQWNEELKSFVEGSSSATGATAEIMRIDPATMEV